jgi:hypothetical protein
MMTLIGINIIDRSSVARAIICIGMRQIFVTYVDAKPVQGSPQQALRDKQI